MRKYFPVTFINLASRWGHILKNSNHPHRYYHMKMFLTIERISSSVCFWGRKFQCSAIFRWNIFHAASQELGRRHGHFRFPVIHTGNGCDGMNQIHEPQDASYHWRWELGTRKQKRGNQNAKDIEGLVKEDVCVCIYVCVLVEKNVHEKLGVIPICLLRLS